MVWHAQRLYWTCGIWPEAKDACRSICKFPRPSAITAKISLWQTSPCLQWLTRTAYIGADIWFWPAEFTGTPPVSDKGGLVCAFNSGLKSFLWLYFYRDCIWQQGNFKSHCTVFLHKQYIVGCRSYLASIYTLITAASTKSNGCYFANPQPTGLVVHMSSNMQEPLSLNTLASKVMNSTHHM